VPIEFVERIDTLFISLIASLSVVGIVLELRSIERYWNRGCQTTAKVVRLLSSNLGNEAIPLEQLDDRVVRWLLEHLDGEIEGNTQSSFRPRREGHRFVLLRYPSILDRGVPRSPVAFAPTLLTALGVLGTFTGIYLGLQQVSLDSISATETLLATSTQLLAGMKVAFFTSLCGLGSASLFVVLLAIGDRVRLGRRNMLRSTLNRIAFLESPGRILSRLTTGTQGIEELRQIRQLQTAQLEVLQSRIAPGEIPTQPSPDSLPTEQIESIAQQLQRSGDLTEQTHAAILQWGETLQTSVSQLVESIEAFREMQHDTIDRLQGFSERLDRSLDNFQTQTQAALAESTQLQKSLLDDVRQRTQDILERSQAAFSSQSDVLQAVGDETVKTMETSRAQLMASLESLDGMFRETRQIVEEELQRFRLDYQYGLDNFFSQQNELLKETLIKQRQNLEEVGEHFVQSLSEDVQQLGNGDR